MAEPQEEVVQQQEPAGGKRSILRMVGMALGVVLTFAIIGLLVFKFIIQPRLNVDPRQQAVAASQDSVAISFDQAFTTVIMPSENMLASTLLYEVTFECSNQETANLVTGHKARFVAMVRKLHSYKTRAELDDPLVEESIRKQIFQEANALLAELQGGEVSENRINAVYHEKFYIQDT